MAKSPLIVPAILARDRAQLFAALDSLPKAVRKVQIDVSDGKFVGSKTLALGDFKGIKAKYPHLLLEAHLMVKRPDKVLPACIGFADSFILHVESLPKGELAKMLLLLKRRRKRAGIALLDKTPLADALPFVLYCDALLLLCIEKPGFQGQAFSARGVLRIATMRAIIDELQKNSQRTWRLVVDGGVNAKTIRKVAKAGADEVDCGSAIFTARDARKAVKALEAEARRA